MSIASQLPQPIQAHLDRVTASDATRCCAWDLWDRSTDDSDGRLLSLVELVQSVKSFGDDVTLLQAAEALVGVTLLEELEPEGTTRRWRWLVQGHGAMLQPVAGEVEATEAEPVVAAAGQPERLAYPAMDPIERQALQALPLE